MKQFTTRLGGTVEVESVADRGSTFRVRLPDVRVVGQERAA